MTNWELAKKAMNEGIKITCNGWGENEFVYFKNGEWFTDEGRVSQPSFGQTWIWTEYQEPAKTKTVFEWMTQYEPGYVWSLQSVLYTEEQAKDKFNYLGKYKKTGRSFEVPE